MATLSIIVGIILVILVVSGLLGIVGTFLVLVSMMNEMSNEPPKLFSIALALIVGGYRVFLLGVLAFTICCVYKAILGIPI